ncbi:hypothetical protein ACES2J_10205 [Bdellovibrio bacteriovorus]|uniref:hypothetical protein n=1 Tax=Bdellovibrio bacteriovorus TaxID=959 RepID=UPI0035A696A1
MKKIILALMAFLISTQACAKENSALQSVLEAMTRQYLDSYVRSTVIKELEEYAGKALAQDLSGKVSTVLAVVNLVDNVKLYNEAESESQRYQALSQAVANAVTLIPAVGPALGALVQLTVVAQGMSAALISKTYALKTAQLIAEITAIEKSTSAIILEEFRKEEAAFTTLIARSAALTALINQNSALLKSQCYGSDDIHIPNPKECLKSSLLHKNLLYTQIQTMSRIVNFQGRFIITATGVSPEMRESMKQILTTAEESFKTIHSVIQQNIQSINEDQVVALRLKASRRARFYRCERLISRELAEIHDSRLKIQTNEEARFFSEISIQHSQQNLIELTDYSCRDSLPELDPELYKLLLQEGLGSLSLSPAPN